MKNNLLLKHPRTYTLKSMYYPGPEKLKLVPNGALSRPHVGQVLLRTCLYNLPYW